MREWVDTALAAAVATVLTSVALAKASALERFVLSVREYRLVPPRGAKPVALAVIGAELALSVGLLAPQWRSAAAGLGIVLLAVLTAPMGFVLLQGRAGVECGCSLRPGGSPVGAASIARNAGLAVVLLLVGILSVPSSQFDVHVALNAGAAGLAIALLYLAFESLAALPEVPRRRKAL